MPSPFPGMDPYLEGPSWLSFHTQFVVEIARQLAPLLQPRYCALHDRYFVRDSPHGSPTPHVNVEIRSLPIRDLVTVIEFLTASTKHGAGREQYLARRNALLRSEVHLVEIDFLRDGERSLPLEGLPHGSYFFCRSRSKTRPFAEAWPLRLVDRLPTIPIPLKDGEPDAPLDLQAAFAAVYDALRWDLTIDYTEPPTLPLPPEAVPWADEHLRAAGLRR